MGEYMRAHGAESTKCVCAEGCKHTADAAITEKDGFLEAPIFNSERNPFLHRVFPHEAYFSYSPIMVEEILVLEVVGLGTDPFLNSNRTTIVRQRSLLGLDSVLLVNPRQ